MQMRSIRNIVIGLGVFVWSAGAVQPSHALWFEQLLKASAFQQANQREEAEAAYQIALSKANEFGPDSEQLGITLNNLGHFSHRLGRYLEAEQQLTRALTIMEARLGRGTAT